MSRRRRKGKIVNGIILLDKPQGLTSNRALQTVKRLFQAQKAGHTGSLDPLATGLLPLCFGEATKISGFLLNAYKSYQVRLQLGITTDSGDADGTILEQCRVPELTAPFIVSVLEKFTGEISQIPPMHSALKKNGVPLYKLAHQGISIERSARKVVIERLDLTLQEGDFLELSVRCSKGTYIRTLVEDIGAKLECGAHVVALRRTAVDPFNVGQACRMYTLEDLEKLAIDSTALHACLLSIDSALHDWPKIELGEEAGYFIKQGQAVFVPKVSGHGLVRLYTRNEGFLGVGEFNKDGKISPKRLMVNAKIG
ncbi:MAG: tRNA pseudouridine(55) synthase TruB [Thiohalomonadales bacterium]